MRSHFLYWPSLIIAAIGAALVPVAVASGAVRGTVTRPMTILEAATTVLLFLRMLFDRKCLNGINAASIEIRDDPRRFGFRRSLTDPKWGLFGSRLGERPLQVVRAILWFEFIAAVILAGRSRADILSLAASAFAVTMMLSIIFAGLNTETASV